MSAVYSSHPFVGSFVTELYFTMQTSIREAMGNTKLIGPSNDLDEVKNMINCFIAGLRINCNTMLIRLELSLNWLL